MVVQVTFFRVLIIRAGLNLFLGKHAGEHVFGVRVQVVDSHFINLGVTFDIGCGFDYFFGTLPEFIRQILSSGHVPLLKLVLLHSMANEDVVWHSSLVKFYIILEIFVLFLIQ